VGNQQSSAETINQKLREADAILIASIRGHSQITSYAKNHGALRGKLDDGFLQAALEDLERTGRSCEPDGKAVPSEFWTLIAEAADGLGLTDKATDLRARAA
jgi:hypothetical protein